MHWRHLAATLLASVSVVVTLEAAQLGSGGAPADVGGGANTNDPRTPRGTVPRLQAPQAEPIGGQEPAPVVRHGDTEPEPPLRPDLVKPDAAADTAKQAGHVNADGVEQLTRGPIHEAFAEPIALDVQPSPVIKQAPPELIQEIPPEARPDGNSEWIPGYWNWDDERNSFIWISGIWRIAPYGHRWVPGHWMQVEGGYSWIGGFWAPASGTAISYLPNPPETLEQGPQGDPPSVDHFWVPGNWMYANGDYAWRPGYWARSNPNWMWIPNHYAWTLQGVVFVAGYWDYPVDRRGLLFAPVYFSRPIYTAPNYWYTPEVAVNVAGLQFNLFARPRYDHYYFGDYYDAAYANAGFYPWYAFDQWRGYEPFYFYFASRFGGRDRDWDRRYRDRYQWYRDHRDDRPPHTFAALRDRIRNVNDDRFNELAVALDLRSAARDEKMRSHLTARQLTNVAENERRDIARAAMDEVKSLREQRLDVEKHVRREGRDAERPTLTLPPRSRIAGREGRDGAHDGRNPVDLQQNDAAKQPPLKRALPERRNEGKQFPVQPKLSPDAAKTLPVVPRQLPDAGAGKRREIPGGQPPLQRRVLPQAAPGAQPDAKPPQGKAPQEDSKQSQRALPGRERSARRDTDMRPDPSTRPDVQGRRPAAQPEARGLQPREQPGRPGRADSGVVVPQRPKTDGARSRGESKKPVAAEQSKDGPNDESKK